MGAQRVAAGFSMLGTERLAILPSVVCFSYSCGVKPQSLIQLSEALLILRTTVDDLCFPTPITFETGKIEASPAYLFLLLTWEHGHCCCAHSELSDKENK